MGLKKAETQVRSMLCDTIVALCRNTLSYTGHFSIEGLLGVTLDDEQIFLININETVKTEAYLAAQEKEKACAKRQSQAELSDSGSDSQSSDEGRIKSKRKRKRTPKKRRREVEEEAVILDDNSNDDSNVYNDNSVRQTGAENRTMPDENTNHQMSYDDTTNSSSSDIRLKIKQEKQDLSYVKQESSRLSDCSYSVGGQFPVSPPGGSVYPLSGSLQTAGEVSSLQGLPHLQEIVRQIGDAEGTSPSSLANKMMVCIKIKIIFFGIIIFKFYMMKFPPNMSRIYRPSGLFYIDRKKLIFFFYIHQFM